MVDEETAPVVELIFQLCVEGNGPGKIARMLKEREIPTPGTITFQRTGQTSRYFPDDPCRWNPATVLSILGQDAYLGRTTNFKTTKLSYKSKKTVINSPDKWAVFLVWTKKMQILITLQHNVFCRICLSKLSLQVSSTNAQIAHSGDRKLGISPDETGL